MYKYVFIASILIVSLSFLTACNDTHDHDHLDIVGFEIRQNDQVIVTQARNPQTGQIEVTGRIDVQSGESTPLLTVVFFDPDGHSLTITESDFSLNVNPVNTSVMTVHHNPSQARWGFTVEGKQVGTEAIQISVMHGNHADFESRSVTVQVHSSGG
ncbi:MAG: hypothetical protein EA364_05860 [Balneolaceae bacterium]|jgi:hypothetical protein|nr:MAG: hypothetical protein EA364_05860 [Balneolaceae bacterium]